ncbi:calcium-binding protein [Actinoplanes sp. NEAU-A12]|uniref:Calcium-binding protein n=1 Tax=Actinoplanes sandaracinus TaxID=3045177 RepID=A0ABT6WTN6_9ACTN|nr:calcium-binding protein [Actinoplanes sandaracinus]MDI6103093.1 calcium-binding protein [Actinoplanes sandaracinus]
MARSRWLPRITLPLLATVSATAVAVPAQAASVGVASVVKTTIVQFKAAAKQKNRVVVTRSGNTVTIDDRVKIKAGPGCRAVKKDKTKVTCRVAKAPTLLRVYTYDAADSITNKTNLPLTASGGTGKDTIVGGPGADALHGDSGNDTLYGNGGDDGIWGDGGNDRISGGDGNDRLYGWTGDNRVWAGNGDDHVEVWTGTNEVWGGAGKDTVYGSHGVDRLWGGDGRDELFGQGGDDAIDGGAGPDHVSGEDGDDVVHGGADDDVVLGNYGNDTLFGGDGDDELRGENGDDRVYGEAGIDEIWADAIKNDGDRDGQGTDYYSGGAANDSVVYRNYRASPVTADPDGVSGDDGADGERDTIATDVEGIWGGFGDDTLTGGPGTNFLHGQEGNDTLRGLGGEDYLFGDDGDDNVDGGDDGARDWVDGEGNTSSTPGDTCYQWALDDLDDCELIITP